MKYRKKFLIFLFCTLFVAISLVCAVFAYMFKQTNTVQMPLEPARVTCAVDETFDGTNKTKIAVKNTGNIDAYLRVRLVSYWVNEDGEIMPEESQMPAYKVSSGWIKLGDHTYYYKDPIAPNAQTPNLLLVEEGKSPMQLTTSPDGYQQVVVVFAEAIQANPHDAIKEAWGVPALADPPDA